METDLVNMWIGAFKAYCSFALRATGSSSDNTRNAADIDFVITQCNEAIKWLMENTSAKSETIKNRLKQLQVLCDPMVEQWREFPPDRCEEFDLNLNVNDMWMGVLKSYCTFKLRSIHNATNPGLTDKEKSLVLTGCNNAIKWIVENQSAEAEIIKERLGELQKQCDPIIAKITTVPVSSPATGVNIPDVAGPSAVVDMSDVAGPSKVVDMPPGAPGSVNPDDSADEPAKKKKKN